MKNILYPLTGLIFLCLNLTAQETDTLALHHNHSMHHHLFSYAPIGVMGDHMHHKGSFMISYRYMRMDMQENLSGRTITNNSTIFSSYMTAPQSMKMDMHMLSIMFAPTNKFTFMLMGNYIFNSMNLITKKGVVFQTQSVGFSDLNMMGLIKVYNKNKTNIHLNIGLSIPTGNINQIDDTPLMKNTQLAYPMQLGSGTFDPSIGATYTKSSKTILWGLQSKYKFRIKENAENYTLGNEFSTTIWSIIKASEKITFSLRANFKNSMKIKGKNANLNPSMMPLFDTKNSGRKQLTFLGGMNFYFPKNFLKGLKLGIEVGYPAYQEVSGVQMKQSITAIIGAQYVFGG